MSLSVELPEKADAVNGQELCRVCGDVANGVHFGAVTCEGCKVIIMMDFTWNQRIFEHNQMDYSNSGFNQMSDSNSVFIINNTGCQVIRSVLFFCDISTKNKKKNVNKYEL